MEALQQKAVCNMVKNGITFVKGFCMGLCKGLFISFFADRAARFCTSWIAGGVTPPLRPYFASRPVPLHIADRGRGPATVCGANLDARLSRAQLPFSLSKAQKISLHRSVCSKRSTCMAGRYFYSFLLNLKDQPSTQSTASIMESTKGISLMIRSPRPNERMAVTMNCNGPFPFFSNRPLARYFSSSGI